MQGEIESRVGQRESGYCLHCGQFVERGLILAEEHGNSGPGRTAVACAQHERAAIRRPRAIVRGARRWVSAD